MNKPCPVCKDGMAVCDTVDNGVGEQQCGPYVCPACGWIEEQIDLQIDEELEPF